MSTITAAPQRPAARWIVPLVKAVAIVAIIAWSLFPIYWALNTSFMSTASAQQFPPPLFPHPFDTSNYSQILNPNAGAGDQGASGFWQSLLNTFIQAGAATVLTIGLAICAAYAFTRLTFPFKRALFFVVLSTMAIPVYAILIPLYRLMSDLGLVGTHFAIILVDIASFMPLALWILYSQFESIPKSLEEAAFVDGASPFTALWRIIVPVAMPGIISAGIIVFLLAWGNFVFPLVLTGTGATTPLTVWISTLQGRHIIPYTLLNAAGILAIAVPLIVVGFLSRKIVAGLLAGSTK
jgi:multiple sugar transport system permease protein